MKFTYCAFVALMILFTSGVVSQPKIKVVQGTEFSFGKVYKGTRPTQIMTIKNVGSDTLNITEVSAQCGCTATMMSKQKLAPSDSGNLSISFNTGGYNGQVTKHVYLKSNDPQEPDLTIEFMANVVQSLNPEPDRISFMISKTESTYSKVITLTNMAKESIKILSVKTEFPDLKVSLLKNQLMPGEQTELQAVLHVFRPVPNQGTIELKTDHLTQPKIDIPVFEWLKQQ